MQKGHISKYIVIISLITLGLISFMMIKSYLLALLGAFIISYLVRPLYNNLEKKTSKKIAAVITIIIFLSVIATPLIWTFKEIIFQGSSLIENGAMENIVNSIQKIGFLKNYQIKEEINNLVGLGIGSLSKITSFVIDELISLFIMILGIYYILIEWDSISSKIKNAIPFPNKEKLVKEIGGATSKIIHELMLIAVIEFVIASFGFWLAGVDFFILLATLTALLAFIPGGPGIVWMPLAVYQLINGQYLSLAIITATGIIISVYVDTIFRAKIVSKDIKIHPLVSLIGLLGGTSVFGVLGIIIGPLFLSYTIRIFEEVLSEYN